MDEHKEDRSGPGDSDNQTANTGGGAYVGGNVSAGETFVGRDYIYYNVNKGDSTPAFEAYPTAEKDGPLILRPQLANGLATQLAKQRLLIIKKSDTIDWETLTVQLIRMLKRVLGLSPTQFLHCKRWSDDERSPALSRHFRDESPIETAEGVYLVLNASPTVIVQAITEHVLFSRLEQRLAERNQYLLLITAVPRSEWNLPAIHEAYWRSLPEDCYDDAYLAEELRNALTSRQDLPPAVQRSLSEGRLTDDDSLQQVASELGSLPNLDLFVALLVDRYGAAETWTSADVRSLQDEVKGRDLFWTIRYFFDQLPDDQQKVTAVGLCFFGDVTISHFVRSLERLMQGAWRYLFDTSVVFDYVHLNRLNALLRLENGYVKHRYANQLDALIAAVWREYQYHLHKALPECVALVIQTVDPKRPYPKAPIEDQRLRLTVAQALGMMGTRSPIEIESPLLRLAAHRNSGVQLAAARALAVWYQNSDARQTCLALMRRWLARRWPSDSDPQPDVAQVDLTLARMINDVLRNTPSLFTEDLLDLFYDLFRGAGQQTWEYLVEFVFPKLPSAYLDRLVARWQAEQKTDPKQVAADVPRLLAFTCGLVRRDVAVAIVAPLFQEFRTATTGYQVIEASAVNSTYLGEIAVWVLRQQWSDGPDLLLVLSKLLKPHSTVLDTLAEGLAPTEKVRLLQLLESWQQAYQSDLTKEFKYVLGDKYDIHFWTTILPRIALLYEEQNQFSEVKKWLDLWPAKNNSHYRWRFVEALVAIHGQQLKRRPREQQPTADAPSPFSLPPTEIEVFLLAWLLERRQPPHIRQVVFLFYVEQLDRSVAVGTLDHTKPARVAITPFLLMPFHRGLRRAFLSLRPLSNHVADVDKELWRKIMYHWASQASPLGRLTLGLWLALRGRRLRKGITGAFTTVLGWFKQLLLLPQHTLTWSVSTVREIWQGTVGQLRLTTRE